MSPTIRTAPPCEAQAPYWSQSTDELFADLRSTPKGLSTAEATGRLKLVGPTIWFKIVL